MKKIILVISNIANNIGFYSFATLQLVVVVVFTIICSQIGNQTIDIYTLAERYKIKDANYIIGNEMKNENNIEIRKASQKAMQREIKSNRIGLVLPLDAGIEDKGTGIHTIYINKRVIEGVDIKLLKGNLRDFIEYKSNDNVTAALLGYAFKRDYNVGDIIEINQANPQKYSVRYDKRKIKVMGFLDKNEYVWTPFGENKLTKDYYAMICLYNEKAPLFNWNISNQPAYIWYENNVTKINNVKKKLSGAYDMNSYKNILSCEIEDTKNLVGPQLMGLIICMFMALAGMICAIERINKRYQKIFSIYYLCGMRLKGSIQLILIQNIFVNLVPIGISILIAPYCALMFAIELKMNQVVLTGICISLIIFVLTSLGYIFRLNKKSTTEMVQDIFEE